MRRYRTTRDVLEGNRADHESRRAYQEADFHAEDARRMEAEAQDQAADYPGDPDCLVGQAHLWKRGRDGVKRCVICCRRKESVRCATADCAAFVMFPEWEIYCVNCLVKHERRKKEIEALAASDPRR